MSDRHKTTYNLSAAVPHDDIFDAVADAGPAAVEAFIVALVNDGCVDYGMLLRLQKHFRKAVREAEADILEDGGCLSCELERLEQPLGRRFGKPPVKCKACLTAVAEYTP